jgi:hypothetical protein
VRVSVVDTDRAPAAASVLRAVIDSIVDPVRLGPYEAETFTQGGFGVSTDAAQSDDTGSSVLMAYNASGNGTLTQPTISAFLTGPGIWMVKVRAKVSSAAGATAFFRIGVWNVSAAAWADVSPSVTTDAMTDLRANQMATTHPEAAYEDEWYSQDFYWNGLDVLELRLHRLVADTSTQVRVDQVRYRSVFSDPLGEGKAPAGQRVYVRPATPVTINVAATLSIVTGYTALSVQSQIDANLEAYLRGLTFGTQNDVQYARVGTVILDTPGVADYTSLTVNGGTANVAISSEQVAVLGTPAWS